MSAFIACGLDRCPLPFGHDGPCAPRPPLLTRTAFGLGSLAEIPVDAALLPLGAWGLRRVRWTVTVVVEEDTSS